MYHSPHAPFYGQPDVPFYDVRTGTWITGFDKVYDFIYTAEDLTGALL
jgi:hypothetical protein